MNNYVIAALSVPALIGTVNCGMHHHGHRDMLATISRKLELTPSQQESVHAIVMTHHPVLKTEFDAACRARMDLAQAVTDPQATADQIRDLDAKAGAELLTLELHLSQVVKEIAPILTPEQHAKARQMVQEARTHMDAFLARRK